MPSTLVLIPTELERQGIAPRLTGTDCRVELCGFGMAAAAARAARLLADIRPGRVMLVGIGGAYDARLSVGTAWRFGRVGCYGIGAGSGDAFMSAEVLGWPHWPGDPGDASPVIGDVIPCAAATDSRSADLLLTVAAASGTAADAARRRLAFPDAVAEDMEGFAVGVACRLAGVPLTIVRGISNVAGDRDKAAWRLAEAVDAAADLASRLVVEDV